MNTVEQIWLRLFDTHGLANNFSKEWYSYVNYARNKSQLLTAIYGSQIAAQIWLILRFANWIISIFLFTGIIGTLSKLIKVCVLRITPSNWYFILSEKLVSGGVHIWCELPQVYIIQRLLYYMYKPGILWLWRCYPSFLS